MLEQQETAVATERSTTRSPLTDADARNLLASVDRVIVARGRKRVERPAREVELGELKGPTGKYRAPILVVGDTLLVGFHAETVDELLGR